MRAEPIRIFIGASPSEWLPAKVLEYSIKVNTKSPVKTYLLSSVCRSFELPLNKKNHPRTPFSFQRFLIPEICGYQGRAIYLDADMLVFNDINAVWETDFEGADLLTTKSKDLGRSPQYSVMLLDCGKLSWSIENIINSLNKEDFTYEQLMYELIVAKSPTAKLPWEWNSLEYYDAINTNLLHYTDMNTQPWISRKNEYYDLWVSFLARALADGSILMSEIVQEVNAGFVRPSLLQELSKGKSTDGLVSNIFKLYLDEFRFAPPYKTLKPSLFSRIKNRWFKS